MRHAAIHWKTSNAQGVVIVDGNIRDWPDSLGLRPTEEQITVWIAEYGVWKQAQDDAEAARIAAKAQAFVDNLPSWVAVDTAITKIANLADAKTFIRKLARVVYWDVKDKAD